MKTFVFKKSKDKFDEIPEGTVFDYEIKNIDGETVKLSEYKENKKLFLFVNVASC